MRSYDEDFADVVTSESTIPTNNKTDINRILEQRASTYGDYGHVALLSQTLKNTIMQHYFQVHGGDKAAPLPAFIVEGITMICHKLARAVTGEPLYKDNYTDIAGYAQLIVNEIEKVNNETRN